jgi:DNA-binding NtrC family response regulator
MDCIRLLVVEDDAPLAKAMKGALSDYGYKVTLASSVSEAIELLAADSFHVLVTDWVLERHLGRTVMEFARINTPEVPIICFSAHSTTDSECAHWADEFVLKGSTGADRLRSAIIRRLNTQRPILKIKGHDDGKQNSDLRFISEQAVESIKIHFGTSLLCWSDSPTLNRDFIVKLIRRNYSGEIVEIDCGAPDFEMAQVVGQCEIAGERSTLVRGGLDTVQANWCVLKNIESLEFTEQRQLASIIGNRQLHRIGSNRFIEFECFVGLTTKSPVSLCNELLDVVEQQVRLPGPEKIYRLNHESSKETSGTDTKDSGTVASAIDQISEQQDCYWPFANSMEELMSIGPRALQEYIFNVDNARAGIKPWKEVESLAKILYLGQVLHETKGNVSSAAKLSGVQRNAIYELLGKFKLSLQGFRQQKK